MSQQPCDDYPLNKRLRRVSSFRTKAVAGPSKNRSTSRKQATPILLAPAKAGSIVQTRRSHTSSASASSSRTSSQRNIKREVDLPLPPPAYYEHQPCSCQGGTQHLCIPCKTSGPSPSYRSVSTSACVPATADVDRPWLLPAVLDQRPADVHHQAVQEALSQSQSTYPLRG